MPMYIEVNQKYLIHLYLEEIRHYNLAPVVAVWIILVGDLYEKWKYVMYGCVWVTFYWLGAMGGPWHLQEPLIQKFEQNFYFSQYLYTHCLGGVDNYSK